jgi:hypothetical protein
MQAQGFHTGISCLETIQGPSVLKSREVLVMYRKRAATKKARERDALARFRYIDLKGAGRGKVPTTTVCDVVKEPATFDNKFVRLAATLAGNFEIFINPR